MDEDFKDCWRDLGVGSIIAAPTKPYNMEASLQEAVLKTTADITAELSQTPVNVNTPEGLSKIVARGARLFVKHWLGALGQEDLGGLLAFMVDGLHLQAYELQTFVEALPGSVLQKFIQSKIGQAKGTHALLALEWHRRHAQLTYEIFDQDGVPLIRVMTEKGTVTFKLDEAFERVV